MKKLLSVFLSVLLFCTGLGLSGCKKEPPWWEDRQNITVKVYPTIPSVLADIPIPNKELMSYTLGYQDKYNMGEFRFDVSSEEIGDMRYPFTELKLFYKGEEVTDYYAFSWLYAFEYGVASDFIPGDYFGVPVPEDFVPPFKFECDWEIYALPPEREPIPGKRASYQGVHPIIRVYYDIRIAFTDA